MASNDALIQIQSILIEKHGLRASKVIPEARIVHDLGVDGDDAAELLQNIENQFGTDFSSLSAQWSIFFNSEGMSLKALALSLPVCLAFGFAGGLIAVYTNTPKWLATIVALALFAGASWQYSRRFGNKLTPITVGGLAKIVHLGAWPNDPADVR